MRTLSGIAASAVALLLIPGCLLLDGNGDGSGAVDFTTTKNVYEPVILTGFGSSMHLEIATIVRNEGTGDIALTGCLRPSSPELQTFADGEWQTVYSVAEPLCLSPPFYFAPFQVYRDTLDVSASLEGTYPDAKWRNGPPVAGFYRLKRDIYRVRERSGFPQELFPLSARVTPVFELRPQYRQLLDRTFGGDDG